MSNLSEYTTKYEKNVLKEAHKILRNESSNEHDVFDLCACEVVLTYERLSSNSNKSWKDEIWTW